MVLLKIALASVICSLTIFAAAGSDDATPMLPGSPWRVHDSKRPRPTVVPSAQRFSHHAPPPADATVLFNGKHTSQWRGGPWTIENGALTVNGKGDIHTKLKFGDCQLHLEFRTPTPVAKSSQHRGNSGVFFFGIYEVQVLDSFENPTYADGQAAAIYGQHPPLVNASKPPGQWQSYDIIFTAPRFEKDKLITPAYVTVLHNGLLVQNHTEIMGRTSHKSLPKYKAHAPKGSIKLQDHHDKQDVQFRNIWIREI